MARLEWAFARSRVRRAQAYSRASRLSPRMTTGMPGPGRTSMAPPATRTAPPTTVTVTTRTRGGRRWVTAATRLGIVELLGGWIGFLGGTRGHHARTDRGGEDEDDDA